MQTRQFLFLLGGAFLLAIPLAQAHFLGYSAVDNGEIRWGGSTQYASEWEDAVATWKALGKVKIEPDQPSSIEDLTLIDVDLPQAPYYGQYQHLPLADALRVNTALLKDKTSKERQFTLVHELGHALGLEHSFENNVMEAKLKNQIHLGPHDKEDYEELY